MTIKRKPKPMPPHYTPEEPVRREVTRSKVLDGNIRDQFIVDLQQLPVTAQITAGTYRVCDNECDYDGSDCSCDPTGHIRAVWSEMETEQELQARMAGYQTQLKAYEKAYKKYQNDLINWKQWKTENKAAIEAEDQAEKDKKIQALEQAAAEAQKKLEEAKKKISKN